ncbi:hypothetical protein BU002_02225 [Mammaliicoccus sciuri]|uniref:hypothetical protein n=1 Tax=Mammaliicoccus sciuri TaxID=1296 RepID=UPI000E6A08F4|nr:hypothetical protein [Mammaliicoccus sciuri]RIN97157.1 hypothetical protein BU002_02225 [Mammaliicoccus sciuri]
MNEKLKDYIMIKGKKDLDLLFKKWDEQSFIDLEIFAMEIANIDLYVEDESAYEFIDNLTFKTDRKKLLKESFANEERTKEELIEILDYVEDINSLLKIELENNAFGTILNNDLIVQLESEKYLIDNNILKLID